MQTPNRTALLLIALLAPIPPAWAADFPAQVVTVHDGDTITISRADRKAKIRLQGIDCPELGQAFGRKRLWDVCVYSGACQGGNLSSYPFVSGYCSLGCIV